MVLLSSLVVIGVTSVTMVVVVDYAESLVTSSVVAVVSASMAGAVVVSAFAVALPISVLENGVI